MKILIDVSHPSDVHLFHYFVKSLLKHDHQVIITARKKECSLELLDAYKLSYQTVGNKYKSIFMKILGMFANTFELVKVIRKHRPQLVLSHGSMYASQAGWLCRTPAFSYEDTGNLEQIYLYLPFVEKVITPLSFSKDLGRKQVRLNTTKEFSYLHPGVFTADVTILTELGIDISQKFVILRFVSWEATHDVGHKGISLADKRKIVDSFSSVARVFISSEQLLPPDLEQFRLKVAAHRMHHVLYFASLLFGESATMASECAILGTSAFFINDAEICYNIDQEKFGLVANYKESPESISRALSSALEILSDENSKKRAQEKAKIYRESLIDLSDVFVGIIKEYNRV